MPVTIIRGTQVRPVKPKRGRRGQHFDEAVRRLADPIAEAREGGQKSIEGIRDYLNEHGVKPPSGEEFSFGSTYRVLRRQNQLGLGPGPRTACAAASARPNNPRESRRSRRAVEMKAGARINRDHAGIIRPATPALNRE
jgi:hypothetical protein